MKETFIKINKKLIIIALGVGLCIGVITLVERGLREYLNVTGYFKALPPNIRIKYDTSEFNVEAQISSQGLRNEKVTVPKPQGVYRILALGDSYTYGWGVAEGNSWPKVLEKLLKQIDPKYEVINAGIPGVGITEERYICQAYNKQFDVDELFLAIYTDDLYQAAAREQNLTVFQKLLTKYWPIFLRINNPIISPEKPPGASVVSSDIWKQDVKKMINSNPTILLGLDPKIRNVFVNGKLNPAIVGRALTDPGFLTFILNDADAEYAYKAFEIRMNYLKDRCLQKNQHLTVVFIPGPSIVNEKFLENKKALGYEVDNRMVTYDIDKHMIKLTEADNISYYSLLPSFRKNGCEECYYPYDGHLTEYGQELVAEYIFNKYEEK